MATRCCCPPERSKGREARAPQTEACEDTLGGGKRLLAGAAIQKERDGDILGDGKARDEIVRIGTRNLCARVAAASSPAGDSAVSQGRGRRIRRRQNP